MREYIIYTSDLNGLLAEFETADTSIFNRYDSGLYDGKRCYRLKNKSKGKHSVCKIRVLDSYYDKVLKPLEKAGKLEFLGSGKKDARDKKPRRLKAAEMNKIKRADPNNNLELQ